MARPRKQTYSLEMYLKKIQNGDILNDADVQRDFVWTAEQINNLMVTVLTDDYIPPIILGEENNSQLHIADGGQRSAALRWFRYGGYKITSAIEDSVIPYKKKIKTENGELEWEDAEFDIKNKTFEKLPDELKKRFDEYQIETVIHENCDKERISKYIKIYNLHTGMNVNQKAFTYLPKFAKEVRKVASNKFFLSDYSDFKEKEKNKGVIERVIVETVMLTDHFDNWKKQTKSICTYLNENAVSEEFRRLENNLNRLVAVMSNDVKDLFNSKDSFVFLSLFDKFAKENDDDSQFISFLRSFKYELRDRKVDGRAFDEVEVNKGTKDKVVISAKLHILESLMNEYLHINKNEDVSPETFISEMVDIPVDDVKEDLECYEETLNDLESNTIRDGAKLLDKRNRMSLLAMVAYSYKHDIDLDKWMEKYASKNDTYFYDQKKNFLHMKDDLNKFLGITERDCA